jgi:hypothetical protein
LRTTETIVFFLVNQVAGEVLAIPHPAAPQRNVGFDSLLLQASNDRCRAVTTIGHCLANVNLMSLVDTLKLLQVGLAIVHGARGNMGVQNYATGRIDRLMHFVFEL